MLAVTGGPGAHGGYVIELAKAAGLIVIADAAETDRALLETLGADVVVKAEATALQNALENTSRELTV